MDLVSTVSTIAFHALVVNRIDFLNVENQDEPHSGSTSSSSSSAKPIPGWRLFLSAMGPLVLLALSYYLVLGMEKKIILALVRSSIQLMFLGYILLGFIFSFTSPVVVFVYLIMMILIAALEATGRQVRTYDGHYITSLTSCFLGGGITGIYASLVVFHPTPWWSAKVMIPTAGMIIGNSVSGPAVATERLLSEVMDKTHELETRLAFGASSYESILPIVRASVQAALLPTFNQMAIMGLVSIPGMMTGQLLGGTAPFTAAEYQMAILYLIVTTSSISTFVSIIMTIKKAVFDTQHRLTKHKITKRSDGKLEIDVALIKAVKDLVGGVLWLLRKAVNVITTAQPITSNNGTNYDQLSSSESTHGLVQLSSRVIADDSTEGNDTKDAKIYKVSGDDEESNDSVINGDPTSAYYNMTGRATYSILEVEPNKSSGNDEQDGSSTRYHQAYPYHSSDVLVIGNLNVLSGDAKKLFHGKGLQLVLRVGERVTLEGSSGIGKTRLLRAISQLDAPIEGFSTFSNHFIDKPSALNGGKQWFLDSFKQKWSVPDWRCRMIYIPQVRIVYFLQFISNSIVVGVTSHGGNSERTNKGMFSIRIQKFIQRGIGCFERFVE
jgi:putative ABC transport system permease protein